MQLPLLLYVVLLGLWAARENPERITLGLSALIAMPTLSLLPGLMGSYVPLSTAQRTGQQTTRMLFVFLVMGVAGILAALTLLAWNLGMLWPYLALELCVMVALHVVLRRWIARGSNKRIGTTWRIFQMNS